MISMDDKIQKMKDKKKENRREKKRKEEEMKEIESIVEVMQWRRTACVKLPS